MFTVSVYYLPGGRGRIRTDRYRVAIQVSNSACGTLPSLATAIATKLQVALPADLAVHPRVARA